MAMASPVGHALVGAAAAGLTAQVTGTPETAALWAGGVIAAGVPDLDIVLSLFGLDGPPYHRNHTHSIFVLALLVAAGWLVVRATSLPVDAGLYAAWTAALATHPLLDLATSGPTIAARGYGIPLLWPVVRRRLHAPRDAFDRDTGDWAAVRNARDLWWRVEPEVFVLGPPCAAVILLVALF
jgi:membrane-bound metal-dependent hydrolase YbcI (DUF457 family)